MAMASRTGRIRTAKSILKKDDTERAQREYLWNRPDGARPDFAEKYTHGEGILVSWNALNNSIYDLWLTSWDLERDPITLCLRRSVNLSLDGSLYLVTSDTPTRQLASQTRYVLRFKPPTGRGEFVASDPDLSSPGFLLVQPGTGNVDTEAGGVEVAVHSTAPPATTATTAGATPSRSVATTVAETEADGMVEEPGAGWSPAATAGLTIGLILAVALLVALERPSLDLSEPAQNLDESNDHASPGMTEPEQEAPLTPPGEEMELVEGEDQDAKVCPPPPRIAARLFYRPTNQARRKDSAASSRRNSISSVHSRSSHGCGRTGGPQSKHVAQHLRRASILEDRKARLASRAAHAEKVRLRAALAKAAARDISASEERALAAAQTRERNLAEIAAACAEEVRRAKAIAEAMKEKREQEMRKLKLQMEERLAEAERRREELRNRNAARARGRERGHSLGTRKSPPVEVMPPVKESKERPPVVLCEEAAASRIQWHWRAYRRRKAVAEFSALGLSLDAVRDTSFDQVTMMLSQERVLVLTARMLRICGLSEGSPGSVEEMTAVRAFLSAFLILGHPSQVLSNKEDKDDKTVAGPGQGQPMPKDSLANPQSQELVGKARDLLVLFENILGRLTAFNNYIPPPALLEAFPKVYLTFYNAFIAWKARDSSSLVELMVMQFVELDAIWESVKDDTDGSVDQVYKESIRNNQVLLLVRIKKLAGPEKGKQLVAEAVKAARKARSKKPRVADGSQSVTETAMGVLGVDSRSQSLTTQTPTPPTTPSKKGEPIMVSVIVPPANRLLPDNRVVVHELAINKEFRTSPNEYHRQQEHLLAPLFQEMRATMQADDQDKHFFLLLRVADMMREKLLRMVSPGTKIHTMISELLDTDMARQQFAVGSFSYEKFFQAIGTLLPKLCAPIRDAAAKALVDKLSHGSYVDRLQALNGFINVMVSDYTNYLLHCAAPQLIAQGPAYEAKAFAADLEAGRHDLSAATRAWRAARQKVLAEAARRDPEGVNHPASRPTANRIYAQLLVDLFTQVAPVARENVPEMLRLDYQRILAVGRTTRHVVTAAAILLQCKNLLKRDVRLPWRIEAQRILAVLDRMDGGGSSSSSSSSTADDGVYLGEQQPTNPLTTDSAADVILAALETGRSMPPTTRQHIRAMVTKFLTASAEAATPASDSNNNNNNNNPSNGEVREPVLRLLLGRLRGHVLGRLAAGSATEKARASSTAGERLAGLGLAEFVDKVREMVEVMGRVSAVDRDAHGPWWDRVAEEVEGEGESQSQGQGEVEA
ncbi:hypothetical protein VTJ49DRAFT_3154 [Mycothermus thermophilus]|uniref:Uncharacterized protein n=1 Tax=Humicola insolens TaxID=85995 RepID=A0ABR3V975_HUMIN